MCALLLVSVFALVTLCIDFGILQGLEYNTRGPYPIVGYTIDLIIALPKLSSGGGFVPRLGWHD